MRITAGDYYDGKRSLRQEAELRDEQGMLSLWKGRDQLVCATAIADVEISSRIGNTPRYLTFPDGATFECNDNAAIDRLVATYDQSGHSGLLHLLESRKRYILISLVLVIVFVAGGIGWGIPMLARTAAYALPAAAGDLIDEGVLELLDNQFFSATTLPDERRQQLQSLFHPLVQTYQGDFQIQVLFREGGEIGPNAMALPSGTIIFTDELVELADTDQELAAVLLHEIGHVVKRHSLRQALQGSVLGVLVVTVTGDVSSLSSIVTAIPVVLTQLGYSRDFEREADQFALQAMGEQGVDPKNFATILRNIERAAKCMEWREEGVSKDQECQVDAEGEEGELSSYISTHPPTEERLRDFLAPSS